MIQGFTQKALLLLPEIYSYQEGNTDYREHLVKTVRNIKEFCKKSNIYLDCFITDDLARELWIPDRWVQTLSSGDMFFVRRNCEDMEHTFENVQTYPELYQKLLSEIPNEEGASTDKRFGLILKRDAKARRVIEKDYKLIIQIYQAGAQKYRLKKNSGVMYIKIHDMSFLAETYMSDTEISSIDLLGVPNANMPVYEWEV